jgi:hypothetical protein
MLRRTVLGLVAASVMVMAAGCCPKASKTAGAFSERDVAALERVRLDEERLVPLLSMNGPRGVAGSSGSAQAGEAAVAGEGGLKTRPKDTWLFEVIPYAWLISMDGTMSVKGVEADVDMSFGDIWDALDFTFATRLTARRNRWGGFLDFTYLALEEEAEVDLADAVSSLGLKKPSIPPGLGSGGIDKRLLLKILKNLTPEQRRKLLKALKTGGPKLRLPSIDEVDIEITMILVEGGVTYLLFEVPLNAAETRYLTVDAYGGGRYTYMKTEMDIDITPGTLGVLPSEVSIEESIDWIEPMVGAMFEVGITDRIGAVVRADASGFGIGSGSQLTWQVTAGFLYQITERTRAFVGYRYYDLDYERGDFEMDMVIKNPIFGLGIAF